MIFVTVGTHEQPFDRLVECVDRLKKNEIIKEDVIIQTGYSTYKPEYCEWHKLLTYKEMVNNVANARIVITHGGPASFIMPLQIGKIPIVVPRQFEFNEHINNHQVEFTTAMAQRMGTIIQVVDIKKLQNVLLNYDKITSEMSTEIKSNNINFNNNLEKIVNNIFGK